ncbi:MAG: efflux transporter periplasmic adaptor subunit, partial [Pseudomonadota bacterium]|nr:efflux transporter periplasmic adaptor subunit [Pseudomonadota bacterium]
ARTMRVEVDMPNIDHRLVPGMYVNVAFRLQPRGQVEVPAATLILRATGAQVARVDGNGKIAFQKVTIARDNGSLVELSSGVNPGDRLVLNISRQIGAGQAVTATDTSGTTRANPFAAQR